MDNNIKKAIEDTAKELGVSESKATKVVENLFNFLSTSMNKSEFARYRLPLFGSFNVIQSRYERRVAAKKAIKEKNNNTDQTNTN